MQWMNHHPEISGGQTELASYDCSGCKHTMQVLDAVHLPGCSMPACIHMIKFSRVMLGAGINYLQKAIQILASLDYLESFFKSMFKRTIETILKPLSLTETRLLNQRASHHDMTWPWTPEPTHPAPPHASQQSQNGFKLCSIETLVRTSSALSTESGAQVLANFKDGHPWAPITNPKFFQRRCTNHKNNIRSHYLLQRKRYPPVDF